MDRNQAIQIILKSSGLTGDQQKALEVILKRMQDHDLFATVTYMDQMPNTTNLEVL